MKKADEPAYVYERGVNLLSKTRTPLPTRVDFSPHPDISAHELARLMPILTGFTCVAIYEDHIPSDLRHHFRPTQVDG